MVFERMVCLGLDSVGGVKQPHARRETYTNSYRGAAKGWALKRQRAGIMQRAPFAAVLPLATLEKRIKPSVRRSMLSALGTKPGNSHRSVGQRPADLPASVRRSIDDTLGSQPVYPQEFWEAQPKSPRPQLREGQRHQNASRNSVRASWPLGRSTPRDHRNTLPPVKLT